MLEIRFGEKQFWENPSWKIGLGKTDFSSIGRGILPILEKMGFATTEFGKRIFGQMIFGQLGFCLAPQWFGQADQHLSTTDGRPSMVDHARSTMDGYQHLSTTDCRSSMVDYVWSTMSYIQWPLICLMQE